MKTLIKNGVLVTMNPQREIIRGDLLLEDDRIVSLDPAQAEEIDLCIDARESLVIPGLIQSHVHLCQTLFRGMADDLALLDWLQKRIWPLEASHDSDSMYISALLGCAELLRGGTTAIIDMASVHHTDAVFSAVQQAGIRYLGGKCLMDCGDGVPDSLLENMDEALQESLDLLQRWEGQSGGKIHYAFCPRFAVSCSDRLLRETARLALHYQVPVHTHASENRDEVALVEQERGLPNVVYLNELGLCNPRLVLAHCIHLRDDELSILAESGTHVAHCPSSNLKLGSGIAPVPELLIQGCNISLGADGPPCNNNLDAFMEMRLAALIQKPGHGPQSMPAQQVFEMATLGGARAMGLERETGSLEPGKKADIAVVSLAGWHTRPLNAAGVYSQLVYQARAADVQAVLVDGKLLMQDGRLLHLDEDRLPPAGEISLQRVAHRAGLL